MWVRVVFSEQDETTLVSLLFEVFLDQLTEGQMRVNLGKLRHKLEKKSCLVFKLLFDSNLHDTVYHFYIYF